MKSDSSVRPHPPDALVDPISVEIIRNKLEAIAEEMQSVLIRTSRSVIVKEGRDASAAIFSHAGEQVAQSTSIPLHLGVMLPALRTFIDVYAADGMDEGDVYALNDPFSGGAHLPDIIMASPVWFGSSIIAFTTVVAHHHDIGGGAAGGTQVGATEIFQEGLRIPPIRLVERGVLNATAHAILAANVRAPDIVLADLHAQLAACHVGSQRLTELANVYGKDMLTACIDRILDDSEVLMIDAIGTLPQGTYHFTDWLDHDGVDLAQRVAIDATVTIEAERVEIDLRKSSDQVMGPFNSTLASTVSCAYFVVKAVCGAEVPSNGGCHRRIRVITRPGSILDPVLPAAVNSRTALGSLVSALIGAFATAAPERVTALSGGSAFLMLSGVDPKRGDFYISPVLESGGTGAGCETDGVDGMRAEMANSSNVPVEVLELDVPVRVLYYRFRTNSEGPGEFRGGLGLEKEFELLRGEMTIAVRNLIGSWGLAGGQPGSRVGSRIRHADGTTSTLATSCVAKLEPGERFLLATAGGGGYGDALVREPSRVLDDVLDGRVSTEAARSTYGVSVEDGVLNRDETRSLRFELAAARGPVNWVFDRGGSERE